MGTAKQNKLLKYILIGCAAVILILSVVLCVTAVKNKDLKNGGSRPPKRWSVPQKSVKVWKRHGRVKRNPIKINCGSNRLYLPMRKTPSIKRLPI